MSPRGKTTQPTRLIPRALWTEFRRDLKASWPRWGGKYSRYLLKECHRGVLETFLFIGVDKQPMGFALYSRNPRFGLRVDALHFRKGHKTEKDLRRALLMLQSATHKSAYILPDCCSGPSTRAQSQALCRMGYRYIERRSLSVDLQKVSDEDSTAPTAIVRKLRRSDEKALTRVFVRAYTNHIDAAFTPYANPNKGVTEYVHGLLDSKKGGVVWYASFVAEASRGVIGDVIVMNPKKPYVHQLEVVPAYQRRGLGSALLMSSLRALKERGGRHTEIGSTLLNPQDSFSFYKRLGFKPVLGKAGRNLGLWIREDLRKRAGLWILGER